MADRAYLEARSRRLAECGRLIEAGWVDLRLNVLPLNAPAAQLDDMRLAFIAGAYHVFGLILFGDETPDAEALDLRTSQIAAELADFQRDLEKRVGSTRD